MSCLTPRLRLGAIPGLAGPAVPRNTILNGDCIDVMRELPSGSVDFILTDPPYLVNYRDRHGRTIANDRQDHWLAPAFAEAFRVLKGDSFCASFFGWQSADRLVAAWLTTGIAGAM